MVTACLTSPDEREQPTTDFIRQIPTVFDEIKVIDGRIGEYIVLAKRKGSTWYLAAMTDWTPRDMEIPLNMLSAGTHNAEIFADGINADRDATDYCKLQQQVGKNDVIKIHLAPGGGWSAIIK